ncbi:hypothetical protein VC279_05985 [Xanthomonas sp. WHRI 10064A]|uniref:hypothetical protein n=1 Tax=unclassified Xanthomonas TaxID=2643310 RepID=UPI002B22B2AB|nr:MULTISPECIES: hypothetical protein [unclassified Xanthomonas]MEA9585861.1 hypothetical protein [Xanthomonas sp. WHRI 10064B]MEA9614288.1 hypothetical protein [Xanthomonas sp. WHRI 10064A]
MPVTLLTFTEFLEEYRHALKWLRGRDVRVDATRLATYLALIEAAQRAEVDGHQPVRHTPELMNALIEAAEVIDIASLNIGYLTNTDATAKLLTISGGPEFMGQNGFDRTRDNAFELSTAAVLQEQDAFGGFSTTGGDLTIAPELNPAECKRISSLQRLRDRLRDAREQLRAQVVGGSPAGVIVIDVTRPVTHGHGYIEAPDDDAFMLLAEQRLSAYLRARVMTPEIIRTVDYPEVLGLIARCRSAGTSGSPYNIRRCVVWQACSIHPGGSERDTQFREIAKYFGPGELREGSRQDLIRAAARVRVPPLRRH